MLIELILIENHDSPLFEQNSQSSFDLGQALGLEIDYEEHSFDLSLHDELLNLAISTQMDEFNNTQLTLPNSIQALLSVHHQQVVIKGECDALASFIWQLTTREKIQLCLNEVFADPLENIFANLAKIGSENELKKILHEQFST